jgi:hypothetical protein
MSPTINPEASSYVLHPGPVQPLEQPLGTVDSQ